jgi:hypothetical protein
MRRILVDNTRRKKSCRHGNSNPTVPLAGLEAPFETCPEDLLALDEALPQLAGSEPQTMGLLAFDLWFMLSGP